MRAIGVSGQQHGLVVLDEAGKVRHPSCSHNLPVIVSLPYGASCCAQAHLYSAALFASLACETKNDSDFLRATCSMLTVHPSGRSYGLPSCGVTWRVQGKRLSCRACSSSQLLQASASILSDITCIQGWFLTGSGKQNKFCLKILTT